MQLHSFINDRALQLLLVYQWYSGSSYAWFWFMQIENVQRIDAGLYHCVAVSEMGVAERYININIKGE